MTSHTTNYTTRNGNISPPPSPHSPVWESDSDISSSYPNAFHQHSGTSRSREPGSGELDFKDASSGKPDARELGFREPSELPSLRRQHITLGYRAGLSDRKDDPKRAQEGFDTGFPIGAEVGIRVGFVIGCLRELARRDGKSAEASAEDAQTESDLQVLLEQAEDELKLEKLVTVPEFEAEEDEVGEGTEEAQGKRNEKDAMEDNARKGLGDVRKEDKRKERKEVIRMDVADAWIKAVERLGKERGINLAWKCD
ncbi:MAG: hypothetical protein Q9162_006438 [Coniocarpon cinnabarinum]